mgnify:CR=1 FL=1
MFRKTVIFLCLALCRVVNAQGLAAGGEQQTADSIRVTLLTCSPGQEVYQLYGHTAIRCQKTTSAPRSKGEDPDKEVAPLTENPGETFDLVFNYGVFDLSKEHFVWNFMLGHTDYIVQATTWQDFVRDYEEQGRGITEQELNLTQGEAERLTARLKENCLPKNCHYRYNFLYRNCTTMVRDMVEQTVFGNIMYPDSLPRQTAREILHRYTEGHPWAETGNDLLLGATADTILSVHAALFIPENMMKAFQGAIVVNAKGDRRPLTRSTKVVLEAKTLAGEPDFPLRPSEAMLALGIACLLIASAETWSRRTFWLWDVILLLLQGSAGTLIAFMFFFSEHPAVGSNWHICILNPVALAGIPLVIKAAVRHKPTMWYAAYFVVLALFLLFSPWIPQVFAKITVPLTLCLLTRPISYYLVWQQRERHPKARKKRDR